MIVEIKYFPLRGSVFIVGGLWIAIMEGALTERTYHHVAFKIHEKDYEMYVRRIEKLNLDIKKGVQGSKVKDVPFIFMTIDNHMFLMAF